jgi:hypothetical protein
VNSFKIEKADNSGIVDPNYSRYDDKGKLDNTLDDTKACALSFQTPSGPVYKLKARRGGHLYNPLDKQGRLDFGLDKKDRTTGDLTFQYKPVSEKAFNNYLEFLRTGYDSFLINAERV